MNKQTYGDPILEHLSRQTSGACIFDASRLDACEPEMFDPEELDRQGRLTGSGTGRKPVHFIRAGAHGWVLRHYWRGGVAAHVSTDGYIRTGLQRSRPVREWRLLQTLYNWNLPVPRPVAARVENHGPICRGDLITETVPEAKTLFDVIKDREDTPSTWHTTGATIARFHNLGVWHADMNTRNILIQHQGPVWLIDWDRGRLGVSRGLSRNLKRLRRSMEKWPETCERGTLGCGWPQLLQGYQQERSPHGK